MVGIASVIKNGNLYQMWYCGVSAADLSNSIIDTPRVGYAYSTNGKNWTKFPGNPILTPFNPPRDTAGPWAPAVVFTGSNYRMWYETAIGFCYATAPPNAITENSRTKEDCRLEIFPNPCTRSCNINYSIPKNDRVKIDIYDIQGRLLKEIVNENQKTGRYIAYWDGRDDKNNQVGGGIYLCVMLTSNKIQGIKKVIVL